MDVGLQLIFSSYGWSDMKDSEVYARELALAERAEELGFDAVWPTEHHFFDYSFCPDNLQLLSYLAGRTKRIGLGTAAVILPWNEPLRVVEKVAMLDTLSGGRVRLGMGRGLSQREFAPFRGIEMGESRVRFDEAAQMIIDALERGSISGKGPMYPQAHAEIRPRPERSFKDRIYAVANSMDSVETCARIGARMIMFAEAHWERRLPNIGHYRARFREHHGCEAPPVLTADFTFCHPDPAQAREVGEQCMAVYLQSLLEHYDLMGNQLDGMPGYQMYAKQANKLREIGFDKYVNGFLAANSYGTPKQMIERYRERRDIIGPFEEIACFRFGGMPDAAAMASMELYAREVMPELKRW